MERAKNEALYDLYREDDNEGESYDYRGKNDDFDFMWLIIYYEVDS